MRILACYTRRGNEVGRSASRGFWTLNTSKRKQASPGIWALVINSVSPGVIFFSYYYRAPTKGCVSMRTDVEKGSACWWVWVGECSFEPAVQDSKARARNFVNFCKL